ncbi:hypothetical protein OV450_6065 [Actinobacteria bacterium OV450]|nr:hypothetical protein OV450_6065 [Actinobacteria bacterium OV450]
MKKTMACAVLTAAAILMLPSTTAWAAGPSAANNHSDVSIRPANTQDDWDLLIECDNFGGSSPLSCGYERRVGVV